MMPQEETTYIDPMSFDFAAMDAPEAPEDDEPEVDALAWDDNTDAPDDATEDAEDGDEEWTESPDEEDDTPPSLNELIEQADDDATFTFATSRGEVQVSKARMAELAEKENEIEEAHSYTLGAANDMKQAYAAFTQLNAESMSETRRRASALQNILADRSLNIQDRGKYSLQLEDEQGRLRILEQDGLKAKQMFLASFEEDKAARINDTNSTMLPRYGKNWQMGAENLYQWVMSMGVPGEDIGKALSPALAEIFILARKQAIQEDARKSKVKAAIAPPKSKPVKQASRTSDSKRQNALAKAKRAGSPADMADLLQFLDRG